MEAPPPPLPQKTPTTVLGRSDQSIDFPAASDITRPHILAGHGLAETDAIIILLLPHVVVVIASIAREIPGAGDPLAGVADTDGRALERAARDPGGDPHHQRDELGGRSEQEGACSLQDRGCQVVAVDLGVGGVRGIQIRGGGEWGLGASLLQGASDAEARWGGCFDFVPDVLRGRGVACQCGRAGEVRSGAGEVPISVGIGGDGGVGFIAPVGPYAR